ncbi:MAG: NAD(P)H-hydrate epimerase, partial [Zetaproteobacteria bacterium]
MKLAGRWVLTAEAMRAADAHAIARLGGRTLMRRAGEAAAYAAMRLGDGPFVILCGPGNNGGDGFAAACTLAAQGKRVLCVALSGPERLKGDPAHFAAEAKQLGAFLRGPEKLHAWLARGGVVIDAIFGAGLARPVGGVFAEAIAATKARGVPVLAVDLPSGIHTDTGKRLDEAIEATATLPIAAYKRGHFLGDGPAHAGRVLTPAPIGILDEEIAEEGSRDPIRLVRPDALA